MRPPVLALAIHACDNNAKMAVKYDKLAYRFVMDPQLRPRYDLQQLFDRPITACVNTRNGYSKS